LLAFFYGTGSAKVEPNDDFLPQSPEKSANRTDTGLVLQTSDNGGGFDRSMQHHLKDLLFKDGVYDPEETVETFSHARN
jgi:hypothetical protein